MPGRLFTDYFLTEGITTTARWNASSVPISEFRCAAAEAYAKLDGYDRPNEAVTEQELIIPVLELLGWTDHLPQQGASRSEDIPDNLVFTDTESKDHAAALPSTERYRQAAVVQESKRFDLPLDASGGEPRPRRPRGNMLFEMPDDYGEDDADSERGARKPHSQILRYLSTAEIESDGRLRWGILTNGRVWRIYDARTRPRATAYFEAYLDDVLEPGKSMTCASSTCSFTATPSSSPMARQPPSSKTPWPRGSATRNRSPRTFRPSSSTGSSLVS